MKQLVAGRYELKEVIGRGPHGVLWRAGDTSTHEDLVVKVLSARYADDPSVVDRFVRELAVLTAFLHPAYVRLRALVADAPEVALVTELVIGKDLRRLVQSRQLSPESAAEIGATCAEALAAGHAVGIVHCDVKPSNVMVSRGSKAVRLTDCRVARLARGHASGLERFSDPRYAAPEVIEGRPAVPATDVYGLGLVLVEMLTGKPFVNAADPSHLLDQNMGRPRVPQTTRALRGLLEACLAADPADRPTATELAADLRRVRATAAPAPPWTDPPPPQHPPTVSSSARRVRSIGGRARAVLACGALAVTMVLGGVAVAGRSSHPTGPAGVGGSAANQLGAGTSAPVPPEAATAESAAGAESFTRYWFDVLNYATATGATGPLEQASSPECAACKAALAAIHGAYQNGLSMQGGRYALRSLHVDSFFTLQRPILRVVFDRTPRSIINTSGQETGSTPGVTFADCQVVLERAGTRWRVRDAESAAPMW